MKRSARPLALAAVLGLLAGCFARAPKPSAPAPAIATDHEARGIVEERSRQTHTLTATFDIEMHAADGKSEKNRGAVVVARPDHLRLQVFTFGVMTAYDFTVAGERYRVRRPLEGLDRTGRFGDAASRGTVDLGQDLRPLFLLADAKGATRIEDAGDHFRVTLAEPGGGRAVDVRKSDGRIVAESLLAADGPRVAIEYSDFRPVDGYPMPFSITVRYAKTAVVVKIAVRSYTRNQPVDPKLFEFGGA